MSDHSHPEALFTDNANRALRTELELDAIFELASALQQQRTAGEFIPPVRDTTSAEEGIEA